MATSDGPIGHRCLQHDEFAERVQRAMALLFREHHEEDGHTHDEAYAATDEAFTRLDGLERSTPAARLAILRKIASARVLRRQYCREANWIEHNNSPRTYQKAVRRYGDAIDNTGLELNDADKKRIGPRRSDVWRECWQQVAEFNSAGLGGGVPAWLVPHYAAAEVAAGHSSATIVAFAERLRARARLLTALPAQPESEVRDDYFEPKYWASATHDAALRDYVRLACLGEPGDPESAWHGVMRTGLALSTEDDDLIAICGVVRDARTAESTFPIWTDPPADLPSVSVRVATANSKQLQVIWTGNLPTGVKVVACMALASGLVYRDKVIRSGSTPFVRTMPQAGRAAVLLQFERAAAGDVPAARTAGTVAFVGAIT